MGGLQHLRTEVQFIRFSEFAAENRPLVTVGGVIAELGGLFQKQRKKELLFGERGFWNSVWPHVGDANPVIDDEPIKARELEVDVVRAFGPVDAALCSVAKRLSGEHRAVSIVTGDRRLWELMQGKISMTWIDEILFA